ncbi:hypothetical protein V6N13_129921 [Hibiscus sabdariffa]|uniref:Protein kinase domain-containing protein n=1 Tax=Hibiscus sabdariffa TaxID=183260 RepID=A0ABR2SML4_9ROSI
MQHPRLLLFFIFTFPSISPSLLPQNNITLYGDAFFRNHGFNLTQETTCLPPSSPSDIGRALYVYPVCFLDLKTKDATSFSCRFSFSIIPNPICPFGNGFVFLIASDVGSVSFSSGHMGLPQLDNSGSQDSFFAVEFDTSFNPSVGEINGNHIGVDVNSVVSVVSVDVTSKGVDLKSGKKITAWIEYKDSAKLILIWLSYSSTKPPTPVLVAQLDLSNHFKEYMHVGFSASNGKGSAMGFHKSRIIGEGASAVVYKGHVPSGGTVAVKRFDQFNQKAFTRNLFNTEFAIMASCLNHCNLVQLQGWCCEESELVLVYEYLSKGSLDRHIHKASASSTTLPWSLRLQVVIGVASALAFLHEECER